MTKKIVVAMSGGVDSSTTAFKLLKNGYEVIGITLAMGRTYDKKAIEDAKKVASTIGIEHKVLDVNDQFKSNVIDYFINSYLSGETPNPCAVCNKFVKFKIIIDFMKEINADFVATGHYAKIINNNGNYELHKATCLDKDQSYFLSNLNYEYLKYIKFPLEDENSKNDVRKNAQEINSYIANKKDSQGVCFIETDYKKFLADNVKSVFKYGEIRHINGKILGKHNGIVNYTIGQRRGIGVSYGRPIYVVKFDIENNIVYVGDEKDLYSDNLVIEKLNLLSSLSEDKIYTIKLRSTHTGQSGKIKLLDNNKAKVNFLEKTRAVTKGQLCCIYDGDLVVGSGWIC